MHRRAVRAPAHRRPSGLFEDLSRAEIGCIGRLRGKCGETALVLRVAEDGTLRRRVGSEMTVARPVLSARDFASLLPWYLNGTLDGRERALDAAYRGFVP